MKSKFDLVETDKKRDKKRRLKRHGEKAKRRKETGENNVSETGRNFSRRD